MEPLNQGIRRPAKGQVVGVRSGNEHWQAWQNARLSSWLDIHYVLCAQRSFHALYDSWCGYLFGDEGRLRIVAFKEQSFTWSRALEVVSADLPLSRADLWYSAHLDDSPYGGHAKCCADIPYSKKLAILIDGQDGSVYKDHQPILAALRIFRRDLIRRRALQE